MPSALFFLKSTFVWGTHSRIIHSALCDECVYILYGNAATRTFGRAHRRRPYGFVWMLHVDG